MICRGLRVAVRGLGLESFPVTVFLDKVHDQ